ncbi:hypothetical protein BTVI_03079 [Pitangus sulphuratus]|nr:hypothetical protein BTVI_03079 [Pitangus sulphuratus]
MSGWSGAKSHGDLLHELRVSLVLRSPDLDTVLQVEKAAKTEVAQVDLDWEHTGVNSGPVSFLEEEIDLANFRVWP